MKIKKMPLSDYLIYSAVIAIGILLDQLTKLLAVNYLKPLGSVPIIKNVLHLTYLTNDGMAFGMFDDKPYIFMIASSVMIVVLSVYLYLGLSENRLYGISIAMVISGGVGNMIDRVASGEVVDFIDFCLINFAVFNVADCFVCIGAGLLIFALVRDLIKEEKKKREEKHTEKNDGEDGI